MKTDYVPIQEVTTAEEARAAALRAAAIRRKLEAAGRAAQAQAANAVNPRRQIAIDRFKKLTEQYEADRRRKETEQWEKAIDAAIEYAARVNPLQSAIAESSNPDGAIIPSRRVASKSDVIKHCRKIATRYGVTFEMVCGMSRRKNIVVVRHYIIRFVARARPDWSLTAMGRMFRRDHTSILHALKKRGRPQHLTRRDIREALKQS